MAAKTKATPEQLAALDEQLAAHGYAPSDPKHPLADRPANALLKAIEMAGAEEHRKKGMPAYMVETECGVSDKTAASWVRDSRRMRRDAVAVVLDKLLTKLAYENHHIGGRYAEEAANALYREQQGQSYGGKESAGSAERHARILAFELLFYGMAQSDRNNALALEVMFAATHMNNEQKKAIIDLIDSFGGPLRKSLGGRMGAPWRIEGEREAALARHHARKVLHDAQYLSQWVKARYPNDRRPSPE